MLLRVERGLGLPARSGAAWHRSILDDAALDVPALRPAIVPTSAVSDWASVMAFRHAPRVQALGASLRA